MAKTSKGVILSQASQIKSDYSFALIKATADNKSLVQDTSSAELKVNALVEYSKDSQWDPKKLTSLGFPAGCFLIVDLRGQDIHASDLITNLALVRQYGYQAGVIDDLSTLDDIKALKANQIYLINSGKTNDDQDASLNGNEITDGSGKLAVGMSVKWQRDYTNVDVSGDHAGFVGMGQDTLLKGGNAFGYSTNGRDFNAVITPKGLIFRRPDAERMWRLLKPNEIADINSTVGDKVKKEVDSATAEIPAAVSAANSAVSAAESAVAASKVNSDAIVAQSEAISEAKSAMDSATAEIQQTAANAASDAAKIRADVARVQNEVDTAKSANSASVEALKSDINTAKQDLADVHDSLTKAQSAVEQNQKAINDSIAEINANVDATNQDLAGVRKDLTKAQSDITANQKAIDDNVAQISDDITQDRKDIADVRQGLIKAQSDITANQKAVNDNVAQINSNIEQDRKDIASAQQANADTAKQLDTYSKQATEQGKTIKTIQDKQDGFTATLADVQGNVSQVSDKVDGLSASLKDTQGNVASVKAQADQLSATLTNHAKSIATLTASANELSSTLEDADGRLSKVEQTAQTNSSTLSDVQGDLSQVKQNATKLVSTLKDAQGNISTLQQKADSVSAQLATAQGDIATLQTGVDSVKATLTSHDKSIHTLQADSKSLKDSMADAQGDISTLSKTATDVTSELEDHTGRLSKVEQTASKQATTLSDLQGNLSQVEQKADSNTATISSISKNAMQDRGVITDTKTSFDSLTQLGTYSIKAVGLPKMPEQHYGTLVVSGSAGSGWLSQQFVADTTGNVYTRIFSNNAWPAWKQGGSQDAINQVKQTADSNSATIRNVQGDVSTLKQTATGVEAALADHEGDIHTLQADNKSLKDSMADAQGDISTLSKTATSLDSEMKDHAGRLSKVEQTASEQSTTLSDLQGNLTQVKQTADNLVTTLKDAQGNIDQIKQEAKGTLEQLSNAQGDITALQKDVNGIKLTITDHDKNIHTLQADSKTLKDDMADAKGNISSLQKTATSLDSEFKDHDGRLSKVEQTATEHTSELADAKGNIDKVTQKANTLQLLLSDAQKNIQNIQLDAKGLHDTLTGQGNQLASLDVTLNNLDSKYSGITGDLQSKQTALSTEQQQTKDMLLNKADKSEVDNVKGTVNQVSAEQKTMADQINQKVSSVEYQTLKDKVNGMKIGTRNLLHHSDTFDGWIKGYSVAVTADKYLDGRIAILGGAGVDGGQLTTFLDGPYNDDLVTWVVYARAENAGDKMHTELWGGGGCTDQSLTTKWQAYKFSGHRNIDHPDFYLWGCVGNKGNIYVALPFAVVGNYIGTWLANPTDTITSINKNSTAIDENSKLISLMAKQTDVDNIKGTAQQISSRLDVMADQIKSKVTSTDVNNIVDGKGYATTSTVQSLITQTAGTINESITNLDAKYNATVTQVQSLTASIDGLQSNVTNFKNDTSSQITQLSNVIQSKVSASDFNALKDEATWKSTDSIDLNTAVLQQKIFVKGGSNLPPGDYWWYVQVEPGYDSRIVQYAVSDRDNIHYSRQYDGSKWSAWSQGATESEITQLRDDINLRVKSGDLLSQINLTAHNTLIQSNKIYLDSSSTVFSGKAFIPSAAIVSLDADKINTGTLNTQMVSIGDDQTRLWARSNYLYLTGKDQGDAYNMRIGGDKIEFVTTEIPNNAPYLDGITPMYQIAYDGDTKSRLKIRSFNRLTGSNEFPIEMYDSVNISKDEIDLAANNQMKLSIRDDGVHVRRSLFFENVGGTGAFGGFTRADNSNIVEFSSGDNNGENFRIGCGARFMEYVYINGYARAQGWLTNSTLSKKMNIRKLDLQTALDKIRQDDQYLYEYKRNVAQGIHDPQASFIIDDVHDVAHYSVPREFIDQTGNYREPNVELAYLIAAFQAIDKQVQKQKEEIKELKEELQHE